MWSPTHVQVTVQRARNLLSKGRKGTNDAFVLIQMGKEKFQTSLKEKVVDPEWYEECDLTLVGRDSDIALTVFHRNVIGLDEFLGQISVPLSEMESFERPFTKWYSLKSKGEKSEEKYRGELEVKIAFVARQCNDTQSLNDLSFKKRRHSIKSLALNVGHKIQKLPSRSASLRNFDIRKHLDKKLKEKRLSTSSDVSQNDDMTDPSDLDFSFSQMPVKAHGGIYSSTLSLPHSAMITSSIQEAENVDVSNEEEEEVFDNSGSKDSLPLNVSNAPKLPPRKHSYFSTAEAKLSNSDWTNRIFSHIKESPLAKSETNLIEALKSDLPIAPTRRTKLETLRHSKYEDLRRHTLHLAEPPNLSSLSLNSSPRRSHLDILKCDSSKNHTILEDIPMELINQYEKMNHKDLVLLVIKLQADLERQRDKILDLENYLDNLLVRVMETTPRILQKPYVSPSCYR